MPALSIDSGEIILESPAGVMAWQIGMLQGNGAGVNWNHALAILFSLANRGALELEETRPGGWFREDSKNCWQAR